MKYNRTHICLSDIDRDNTAFQITTTPVTDALIQSIKYIGLIHPPFLVSSNNKHIIVSGFRRIAACQQLGQSNIEAAVVDDKPIECAKLAISDNTYQRQLNWIEISKAMKLLFKFCSDKRDIAAMLSVLGLPDNLGMAENLLPLSDFSASIQNGLISGQIPLPMAMELGTLDIQTGSLLSDIFQGLGLGLNIQREILMLVKEIAARESVSMFDFLNEGNITSLLSDDQLDRTQKRSLFRAYLKTRRYPAIQAAQNAYNTHIKNLKLPSKIRLTAPKNFEGTQYAFQIDFSSISQLRKHLDVLCQKLESTELQTIVNGFEPSDK